MPVNNLLLESGSPNFIFDESGFSLLLEDSTLVNANASILTYGFGVGSSIGKIVNFGFSSLVSAEYSTASIITYGFGDYGSVSNLVVYGFNLPGGIPPVLDTITGYLNQYTVEGDGSYFLYTEDNSLVLTEDDSRFYAILVEVDYDKFERKTMQNMGVRASGFISLYATSNPTLGNLTCTSRLYVDNQAYGVLNASTTSLASMYTTSLSSIASSGYGYTRLGSMTINSTTGDLANNFGYSNNTLRNLTLVGRASLIKPNYGRFYNYIY